MGRKAADERSDQQEAGIGRIDEIKTHPVEPRHLFVETLGDMLHDRFGRRCGLGKLLEFSKKLFMQKHRLWPPYLPRLWWHPRMVAGLALRDAPYPVPRPYSNPVRLAALQSFRKWNTGRPGRGGASGVLSRRRR